MSVRERSIAHFGLNCVWYFGKEANAPIIKDNHDDRFESCIDNKAVFSVVFLRSSNLFCSNCYCDYGSRASGQIGGSTFIRLELIDSGFGMELSE